MSVSSPFFDRVFQIFVKNWGLIISIFDIATDSSETVLGNHCSSCNNISTSKHCPLVFCNSLLLLLLVRFPACQFCLSKFDMKRPYNFQEVLKTPVNSFGSFLLIT